MSEEKDREAVRSMVLSELLIQEEQKHRVKPEEYDSDMEEALSQIRNLQARVNALEKKLESQE